MPNLHQSFTVPIAKKTILRVCMTYEESLTDKSTTHSLVTHWRVFLDSSEDGVRFVSVEKLFSTLTTKFVQVCCDIQSTGVRWQSFKLEVLNENKRVMVFHKRLFGQFGKSEGVVSGKKCFKFEIRSVLDRADLQDGAVSLSDEDLSVPLGLNSYRTLSLFGVPNDYKGFDRYQDGKFASVEAVASSLLNEIPMVSDKPDASKQKLSLGMVYPVEFSGQTIYHPAISVEPIGLKELKK